MYSGSFSLEYHTFLHHSQTPLCKIFDTFKLEYHTFLHHSQTLRWAHRYSGGLEYHTFLHHSQTVFSGLKPYKGLSTIRFYIILKPSSVYPPSFVAWVPYVFTSFSNQTNPCAELEKLEYHTFLHHSQTAHLMPLVSSTLEYHTFLHHSQTVAHVSSSSSLLEYHTFLHHSQTVVLSTISIPSLEYHTFLHHSQTHSKFCL